MSLLNSMSDQQLIQLYIAGNAEAFNTLVLRHKQKVYTSIHLLLKDKYLAEDIFQDVFIKAVETIHGGKYSEEGKFLPWIMRIAHNMCVDHFRKIKRSPFIKMTDSRDIFEVLDIGEYSAEESIVSEEKNVTVRAMLDKLPEDQREVIILRHYANLSFKEISQITQTSINTALGRMRYGLLNLRKMMVEKQIAL